MSPSKSKNLTPSYAVIQGLYWMYFAAIMSFSGFFLLSGGFTNTQIGILAAIAGLLSAVLQPVLAGYADQPQSPSLKKLIQMLYLLQLILVIGLFLSHSLILTGLLYGSSIALLQLMTPFINSLGKHQSGTFSQFWSCTWNGICRLCLYLLHSGDHYGKSRTCFHPDHCNCPYPAVSWYPYSFSIFQSKIRQHCHECSQKQLRQ